VPRFFGTCAHLDRHWLGFLSILPIHEFAHMPRFFGTCPSSSAPSSLVSRFFVTFSIHIGVMSRFFVTFSIHIGVMSRFFVTFSIHIGVMSRFFVTLSIHIGAVPEFFVTCRSPHRRRAGIFRHLARPVRQLSRFLDDRPPRWTCARISRRSSIQMDVCPDAESPTRPKRASPSDRYD